MFYSEAILSRRGPLAKVWLAAHMERKLSKTQTLQTDIEKSVDAIVGQDVEVMALRLSGQLLLGVVRIYSRKAKYLLDDCNEALLKIKLAFRPGIVDMTEDQLAVNRNAITLQSNDLDILLPDLNWDLDFDDRPVQPQGQHIARTADITLTTLDDFQMDFDDADNSLLGPTDGIGSQDFIDLGLNFGPEASEADETMSVEVGRDAPMPRAARESIASHLHGETGMDELELLSLRSREASEHPFAPDVDMGFGPDLGGDMDIDLGLNFEPLMSDHEKTPGQTTRASSPLSEPPQTPPDIAPAPPTEEKAKRKQKEKKNIVDNETELKDGPGARGRGRDSGFGSQINKDVSEIVTEHHYLPRSTLVMQLLEIRNDPLAYFMPKKDTPEGTFFYAGPPGLAPELAELFMRPTLTGVSSKKRGVSPTKGPNKKRKVAEEEDEDEIERARRMEGSVAPSVMLGSDVLGRASIGVGLEFDNTNTGLDDFQMNVGEFDVPEMPDIGRAGVRSRSAGPSERSRLSTPALDNAPLDDEQDTYADSSCPIALFDERGQSQKETEGSQSSGRDYSQNTVKALAIIRKELQPQDDEPEETVISFNKMAEKASRRAASSFFFELLVLGTRDCVKLSQSAPFENIEIRGKDKLWARQRHSSVAPSSMEGL